MYFGLKVTFESACDNLTNVYAQTQIQVTLCTLDIQVNQATSKNEDGDTLFYCRTLQITLPYLVY